MPKRVAEEYITKENGSSANFDPAGDKPKMSTAAQLAKRKFVHPLPFIVMQFIVADLFHLAPSPAFFLLPFTHLFLLRLSANSLLESPSQEVVWGQIVHPILPSVAPQHLPNPHNSKRSAVSMVLHLVQPSLSHKITALPVPVLAFKPLLSRARLPLAPPIPRPSPTPLPI